MSQFFYIWINEFRFLQLFRIFDRCSCIFDRRVPICSLKRARANGYNKVRSVFAWINNDSRRKFSLWTLTDIFMMVKKSVRLLIFGNIFYLPFISIDHMIYRITTRISFSCFGHIQLFENVLWENVLEPLKTEDGT